MKIWKLVSGILNIILFFFVTLQSCAVGISNVLDSAGEASGTSGAMVAAMLLAGGIVSIVTRNSKKMGGNVALLILYGLGMCIGCMLANSFTDLKIWGSWCGVCMVMAYISMILNNKNNKDDIREESKQ